jgi:hypothetical protein
VCAQELVMQEDELVGVKWMPLEEYFEEVRLMPLQTS